MSLPWHEMLLRLFIAAVYGLMVGMERERRHRPAGIKTHILVCVGASLVSLIQIKMVNEVIGLVQNDQLRPIGRPGHKWSRLSRRRHHPSEQGSSKGINHRRNTLADCLCRSGSWYGILFDQRHGDYNYHDCFDHSASGSKSITEKPWSETDRYHHEQQTGSYEFHKRLLRVL